ncbi:MAG: hypothetical protein J6T28_10425 [Paludibacteraceae bacterium]|nr:hypothetical protein [Paludibacteraceae bacterium]MBP5481116.1 hypothetical protein [Paludibacteraceae bacterium]
MRKFRLLLPLLMCMAVSSWAAAPDFEIPSGKTYTNAEECKADNELVAKTAQYFFTTKLPEDATYAKAATSFITSWVQASDEILISVSNQTTGSFFSCNTNLSLVLFGAYICGCTRYNREVLTSKEFTFEMHYYALEATLRYYEQNKGYLGECKKIDRMLKSLNKGKLRKEQERLFAVSSPN